MGRSLRQVLNAGPRLRAVKKEIAQLFKRSEGGQMTPILLALIVAALGMIPSVAGILISSDERDRGQKTVGTLILGGASFLVSWFGFYLFLPQLIEPLWGAVGFAVQVIWVVGALIDGLIDDEFRFPSAVFPILLFVVFLGSAVGRGSEWLNTQEYGQLVGSVDARVWKQDIQPKDPRHIRTNNADNALYMAKQALGQAGAIGSQYQIDEKHITLQKIGDQFWFVVPLDHVSWSTWRHIKKVPYYIRVSGEDPFMSAELVKFPEGQELIYTPESCWNKNLQRHLWLNGYAATGLMDYTPEVDEDGKYWLVVTTFGYAVNGWSGKKVTGILLVDPVSGNIKPEPLGSIDKWIDRVIPDDVVQQNLRFKGQYPNGDYWNTWGFGIGGKTGLLKPEESNLVFGADGDLYWVTGMTSDSDKDSSLVKLYYTNSRTGKNVVYDAQGVTDTAIKNAINQHYDVTFRKLSGAAPQIYNILGVMTAVVPMLNANHAYQGLGFVDVKNPQIMAFGTSQTEAYEKYQAELAKSGHQIAPELAAVVETLTGVVERMASEVRNGTTMYYLLVRGETHEFLGTSDRSAKLRLTRPGDRVVVSYSKSGAEVEPMKYFDNLDIKLVGAKAEAEVRAVGMANVQKVEVKDKAQTVRENLKGMSDEELVKALEKKK